MNDGSAYVSIADVSVEQTLKINSCDLRPQQECSLHHDHLSRAYVSSLLADCVSLVQVSHTPDGKCRDCHGLFPFVRGPCDHL